VMLVCLREAPADVSNAARKSGRRADGGASQLSVAASLYWTLYNPALWLLGLSLGLLNACRFGFLDWGVTHLMETKALAVDKATLQFFVIAIGDGGVVPGRVGDRPLLRQPASPRRLPADGRPGRIHLDL